MLDECLAGRDILKYIKNETERAEVSKLTENKDFFVEKNGYECCICNRCNRLFQKYVFELYVFGDTTSESFTYKSKLICDKCGATLNIIRARRIQNLARRGRIPGKCGNCGSLEKTHAEFFMWD